MKVLIFSAATGGGHNRASNALKSYIMSQDETNIVEIVDVLEAALFRCQAVHIAVQAVVVVRHDADLILQLQQTTLGGAVVHHIVVETALFV